MYVATLCSVIRSGTPMLRTVTSLYPVWVNRVEIERTIGCPTGPKTGLAPRDPVPGGSEKVSQNCPDWESY